MTTTYEVGQTVSLTLITYSSAGVAADLGGGNPTCTVTLPDGSTASATVAKTSTGTYVATYTCTMAGRHRLTWSGSGANSGGLPRSDVADVWPADPRFICSLDDVKAELNLPASVVVNDDELRLCIAAATPVVEALVGRVLQGTIVETFDGGGEAVLLSQRAASVTSVTVGGTAVSYVANLTSGIVWAGTTSAPSRFDAGRQNVTVTYVAGGTSVDPNVVMGARIIAAQQYQVTQQGRAGRGRGIDDVTVISSGYAVPNRALEYLKPSAKRRMPGFA